jgi:fatty-acid peroxygenase
MSRALPQLSGDRTLALLRDPYGFVAKRCGVLRSDAFETRILFQRTICLSGRQAAEVFYDSERFQRTDAAPQRVRKTLFGEGGVQGLDGDAHRRRKAMFLDVLSPERVDALASSAADALHDAASRWSEPIVLYDEVRELLANVVCAWAGVPGRAPTDDLTALFEGAGAVGPPHGQARRARKRLEAWGADLVERTRSGERAGEGTALAAISNQKELKPRVAAVELLNILRPTVAVSVFIVLAALALHQFPHVRASLESDDDAAYERFAQEVRRFFPFFPAVVARVRKDFVWEGYDFRRGRRALLDLYGTNHDARAWADPDEFRPERFLATPSPYAFVPQGGGDVARHHRCPGERVAVELTKVATRFLVRDVRWTVPEQDLRLDLTKVPALPRSRLVVRLQPA